MLQITPQTSSYLNKYTIFKTIWKFRLKFRIFGVLGVSHQNVAAWWHLVSGGCLLMCPRLFAPQAPSCTWRASHTCLWTSWPAIHIPPTNNFLWIALGLGMHWETDPERPWNWAPDHLSRKFQGPSWKGHCGLSGKKCTLSLPGSISCGERHGLVKHGAKQRPLLSRLRAGLLFVLLNF